MAYILCLETATTNCSVSIAKDGKVITCMEDYNTSYSHAERLHLFIDEVMTTAKLAYTDLDAIAVSKGPGSYTGLRIGVAAAKGLCYALGIPLISTPTLHALALQVPTTPQSTVVAMLDARRMEVYSGVFSETHQPIRETKAEILTETSFLEYLEQGKVYFTGTGVEKFSTFCTHPNAHFIHDKLPSSKEMATISYDKLVANAIESLHLFDPYYLKDFVMS